MTRKEMLEKLGLYGEDDGLFTHLERELLCIIIGLVTQNLWQENTGDKYYYSGNCSYNERAFETLVQLGLAKGNDISIEFDKEELNKRLNWKHW